MTARLLGEQLTLSQLRREDLRERLFALLDALDDNAGAAVLRSTEGLLDAISTRVAGLDASARQAFDWGGLWSRILAEGVLPAARLPASGVTAGTYASPSSMTVDAAGRVTAISAGSAVSGSRQVLAGTGLSGGGPLSADVTLSHAASAVTAGTYASPSSVTVDARGHITAITAGSGGSGLGDTWSSGPLTFGGPTTLMNLPTPPSSGGGLYWVRVITGVQGLRITLRDAQGATVGQTQYQPGGGDGPDGSERTFRRGAASANVPTQVELSAAGNGLVIEIFRP
jgi:hypothetical protein